MKRLAQLLGSLMVAVPLLVAIGGVLAWGTIYETRFGTSAAQRFVYHAWWFQLLLGFLAVNLAVSAWMRYPWKRAHTPFLCAHLGIILLLVGGILSGRFGIEGQMVIPKGGSEHLLLSPEKQLMLHDPQGGASAVLPAQFETQRWRHEPDVTQSAALGDRVIQLAVDRYYPDAVVHERVEDGAPAENPAVHLVVEHEAQADPIWLLARDQDRFGARWGGAHLLFLEPASPAEFARLLKPPPTETASRGAVSLTVQATGRTATVSVPASLGRPIPVPGTPYQLIFKGYFPDFAITESGPTSRSAEPRNPAVALTVQGSGGTDAYLLFALHPEISAMHGWSHTLPITLRYTHDAQQGLPSNAIGIVRAPSGTLAAVLTGPAGERQALPSLAVGTRYTHPWLHYQFAVEAYYPRARLLQDIANRSDEVRNEMLHLTAREGAQAADGWVALGNTVELALGASPVLVEFRQAQRPLPFSLTLRDVRRKDYPGTQMPQAYESDVTMTDPEQGVTVTRTIRMNMPLKHRGYTFFQASYIPGEPETTVLAVRNDPGTPFVYAGFLIVIAGLIAMFVIPKSSPGA